MCLLKKPTNSNGTVTENDIAKQIISTGKISRHACFLILLKQEKYLLQARAAVN